jgi:hypothetical protein
MHSLLIDEAFVGVAARDIAFNHTPMWDAVSNAPYVWGLAQIISIFGDSPWMLRFPSALFGASLSLIIYFFVRRSSTERIAILSAAIYALHPFAAAFTRLAFVDALQLPMLWLAIYAIDRYMERPERKWLLFAISAAALAFIFKYNALAVLACWMLAGLLLRRYPLKTSLLLGAALVAASLATLLLWPFDAPLWFFSFLAKGGTYDGSYIWGFYLNAIGHVTLGVITLLVAATAYLFWMRRSMVPQIVRLIDQMLLFGVCYFGLLLFLGRPFQRYLLMLTIPVAVLYGAVISEAFMSIRVLLRQRTSRSILFSSIGLVVLAGMIANGSKTWINYADYLHNDLMLEEVARDVRDAGRVFWPGGAPVVLGYYLGFDQFYSRSTRGALDPTMSHHYFEFSNVPYSADTLPYGVLIARNELKRVGLMNALSDFSGFRDRIRALDNYYDKIRHDRLDSYYYTSDLLKPGDLMIESHGIDAMNGEPYFEQVDPGRPFGHQPASGFEFVAGYSDGHKYLDTLYPRYDFHPELRILRKIN